MLRLFLFILQKSRDNYNREYMCCIDDIDGVKNVLTTSPFRDDEHIFTLAQNVIYEPLKKSNRSDFYSPQEAANRIVEQVRSEVNFIYLRTTF